MRLWFPRERDFTVNIHVTDGHVTVFNGSERKVYAQVTETDQLAISVSNTRPGVQLQPGDYWQLERGEGV